MESVNPLVSNKQRNFWVIPRLRVQKQTRPEVIVISKKGDMSYCEILRKVNPDPELIDLGGRVSRIRHTQKGDLLLELNKSSEKIVDSFHGQVEKVLGE